MKEFEINKIRREGEKMIVTVPKKSLFKVGDYVAIQKVSPNYYSASDLENVSERKLKKDFGVNI